MLAEYPPTSALSFPRNPYLGGHQLHQKKGEVMAEKKLFLLDGHALVYRAHYAFINRPLINSKGITSAPRSRMRKTLGACRSTSCLPM